MKKRDILLLGVLLLAGAVMLLCMHLKAPAENAVLRITVDGELFGEYSLDMDQEIDIKGKNICEIENGSVLMTEADCPDLICVHTAAIDARGGTIVCLPNKVVLSIENAETDDSTPDIIAR